MMVPTDDSKPTRPPKSTEPSSGGRSDALELPVGRAFLVQLASDCDAGEDVHGRVEHVRTGEAARFQSLPELVAFMLGMLKPAQPTS